MRGLGQHNPSAPSYALEKYTPRSERKGMALCLSGGGFRATLFHLGALRRLNELGVLAKITTITSVSGGSIMAAHLASAVSWPVRGPIPDSEWEKRVEEPLRAFARKNLRTVPILKRWLLLWNWCRTQTQVKALAASYEKGLTPLKLADLPEAPRFTLCATDLNFGVDWVFEKRRMGDYEAGYTTPPADWPLARAVAASSCFPPVFDPLVVRVNSKDYIGGQAEREGKLSAGFTKIDLNDGGNYDNLGLEPVWKDHGLILCSDGGEVLNPEPDQNFLWRLARYISVVYNQAGDLRKRWLISNFIAGAMDGAYWGIGSSPSNYGVRSVAGYSKDLARKVIAVVRTDLDAFSEAEIAVLENHGYLLADAAIRAHLPQLVPPNAPPAKVPYPDWMEEAKVRTALAGSRRRTLLGRW